MIYVTVGHKPFPRLTNAIPGFEGEAVIFQDQPFPRAVHAQYIQDAAVVVTHAGAGNLMQIWKVKKVPVVMPRLKAYGEHVDDHQLELTKALEPLHVIVPVYDMKDLDAAIDIARRMTLPEACLKIFLDELCEQVLANLR